MTLFRTKYRAIFVLTALLVLAGCGVLLREYLMLRRIEATLRQDAPSAKEEQNASLPQVPKSAPAALVDQVRRSADGSKITARVNFAAFKRMVEAEPALLRQWGRIYWKIVDDTPALCIRSIDGNAPFAQLGARKGDCITHIDGESINQPLRNMGIWLTLGARSKLSVETLRAGRPVRYDLRKI